MRKNNLGQQRSLRAVRCPHLIKPRATPLKSLPPAKPAPSAFVRPARGSRSKRGKDVVVPPLTVAQIYAIARAAGFPPVVAVTMAAIAMCESSGIPTAHNGSLSTGDNSFGLWQINLHSPANYTMLVAKFPAIAQDPRWLLDPKNNALAAAALWAGNNKNLSVAWYAELVGASRERYESHLAAAQTAALAEKCP